MIKQVVVTDAWFEHEDTVLLNPALKPYEQILLRMKQSWSKAEPRTPLSYYAGHAGLSAAAMCASLLPEMPKDITQVWVASPYQATMTRTSLRVLPEYMLDWTAETAAQVCEVLNPLLAENDLNLVAVDEILLLLSKRVWDVSPPDFAQVSGASLPDKHMQGSDAGEWARMLLEVQMMLHQTPVYTASGAAVQGLWFWAQAPEAAKLDAKNFLSVASKHVYLNAVLKQLDKQQNAEMIITESELLPVLLPTILPQDWLLLGAGQAVQLKNNILVSALSKMKKPNWKGIR